MSIIGSQVWFDICYAATTLLGVYNAWWCYNNGLTGRAVIIVVMLVPLSAFWVLSRKKASR